MDQPREEILAELRKIDTPTITNAVATYPDAETCLALYDPWTENWYTDSSLRCMYPELGPAVGHAVTCVYRLPDESSGSRLTFMDVIDALDAMPKPTILVIEQSVPARDPSQGRPGGRDHGDVDEGDRMCRSHL